jgi:hypothetical protein
MSRAQGIVGMFLWGASGVLWTRIATLEAYVDEVARAAVETPGVANVRADRATEIESRDRRLDALAAGLETLRADADALAASVQAKVDRADLDRKTGAERVVGLVEGELARLGEIQLAQHKERWTATREKWVRDFSDVHRLSETQQEAIRKLLLDELDGMMDILQGRDAQEDLGRASAEWKALLQDTDRRARVVLDPRQTRAWDQARAFERSLWKPYIED